MTQRELVRDRKTKNIGIFLVMLAFGFLLYKGCQYYKKTDTNTTTAQQNVIAVTDKFVYTKHARCRMECRNISEDEVMEVVREGKINYEKSEQQSGKCPTYAIEDVVRDGSRLRIVFAKCDKSTRVVTCIDLDKEFSCSCE